ncbi:MAG: Flp pilus assembly protein CpaB [Pseudolabrys sp.]
MKAARIVVLAVAIGAGGVAAMLAGRSDPPPPPAQPEAKIPTVDVLIARTDIGLGQTVSAGDMEWQSWPTAAKTGNFIRKSDRPDALESLSGSIARAPFVAGEPIREAKLVKAKGSGYMAAILPTGMRAVSTEISPETGAGGFILPNDRVDVILSRRGRENEKDGSSQAEIILSNVRVLAIDQAVEEKNGQKVVLGKTATLELSPPQAETLATARTLGTISLALRSITDAEANDKPADDDQAGRRNTINVIRFGVSSTATTK